MFQAVEETAVVSAGKDALRQIPAPEIPASEVLAALSYALDLTEGQPMGHTMQACVVGMRIGRELGLRTAELADLYYALLLKDAGCSSNSSKLFHIIQSDEIAAKGDLKDKDWARVSWDSLRYAVDHVAVGKPFLERVRRLIAVAIAQQADSKSLVQIRCERGASIARRLGFGEGTAQGIASLDEHWDGGGYPKGLSGAEIPLIARIMNLAQTLVVFWTAGGAAAAETVMAARSGKWFDPDLVRMAAVLSRGHAPWEGPLWEGLDALTMEQVAEFEPVSQRILLDEEGLDKLCLAFAEIIDAKSPFTYRHSEGVAGACTGIAAHLGLADGEITLLRRAALLHDIGKLSVPNTILEKPGKLDAAEWAVIKKHPEYSQKILERVPCFIEMSRLAATHHEKLDGSGYFRSFDAEQLSTPARIVVVADIFDALSAARPYREALPLEKVFEIMRRETPHAIDADCLEALRAVCTEPEERVA